MAALGVPEQCIRSPFADRLQWAIHARDCAAQSEARVRIAHPAKFRCASSAQLFDALLRRRRRRRSVELIKRVRLALVCETIIAASIPHVVRVMEKRWAR